MTAKEKWFSDLFEGLSKSKFRSSFHLDYKDIAYIDKKGWDAIQSHARDFVTTRLAPAAIPNDGKQTPYRGHPVFKAQHATATCCRGCLYKWHHLKPGRALSVIQIDYVVEVIMTWLRKQYDAYQKTHASTGDGCLRK